MSHLDDDHSATPYSPLYIRAWTILSLVLGLFLFSMFFWGDLFLYGFGKSAWDLLRWICSPII